MNKTKGFTLVELLAVVIVIGLISAISVPVVRNITKDARQKGLEKQISVLLESTKNWAVTNSETLPKSNSSILVKINTLKKEGFLENKKIVNPVDNKEMTGCIEVSYDTEYKQYEYKYNEDCSNINKIIKTENSCLENGECSPGTELKIQVNDSQAYNFYVIDDAENTLTLIMDRNLGEKVAWVNANDYVTANTDLTNCDYEACNDEGPITALNYLNVQTSTWTNIEPIENYTYNNNLNESTYHGYQKLEINNGLAILIGKGGATRTEINGISRAILLTDEEISAMMNENNNIVPAYLYTNLSAASGYPAGYWLLTTYLNIPRYAHDLYYDGDTSKDNYVYSVTNCGIRPVIEIQKITPIY